MHAILFVSAAIDHVELELLRRQGYAVSIAASAAEALGFPARGAPARGAVGPGRAHRRRPRLPGRLAGWRQGLRWANVPVTALARQDASVLAAVQGAARPGPPSATPP